MKALILSFFLLALASSYTYQITSESNCLAYDPTHNVCSKWAQSGTIEQDVSCFIGQTLVKQKSRGYIQIKDLNQGDQIFTLKNGNSAWSQVQGWLHKSDSFQGRYHNVTLENGEWIGVSGKHNIAFEAEQEFSFYGLPSDATEEKSLYPCSKKIVSKQTFMASGKYAPLTSESSYVVFTGKKFEPILVHDFANIRNPQMYEVAVSAVLELSKIMNGGHLMNADGVHMGADWMMDKFPFLME